MASAFPLLGIVYTMMAETVTETEAREKQEKEQQLTVLAELSKQTNLPITTLRKALASGSRFNAASLLSITNRTNTEAAATPATTAETVASDVNRPITGQIVAIGQDTLNPVSEQTLNSTTMNLAGDGNPPDKLQMTIEALRVNPHITDEALAYYLSLKRPASARFWRLKAIEILNTPGREQTGKTAAVRSTGSWSAPAGVINGKH
jgi:hypothetical protein